MAPPPGDDGPRDPAQVPELVAALRADLAAARYTVPVVEALLGPVACTALMRDQILPADLATRDDPGVLAVLVRLFALGRDVPRAALDAALPGLGAGGAEQLGLVQPVPGLDGHGGAVRPRCDLRPYGDEAHDWWVASDLAKAATGIPLLPTHVLGVGAASTTTAQWTVRRPVRRALDLGTGCGVQSLHLADHAERIVATDVSSRALAYVRFNTALAGLELDLRQGSLFEPVVGDRFDLVVSNPPFVITPRSEGVPLYEYRDGGLVGDGLVEALVRGVGAHLEPAGVAQFLGNWEVAAGGTWRDRWAGWLAGSGLDALVVQREQQDPAEYAELWARDGGSRPGVAGFTDLYAAWLADFAARGVERIGFGVVTLQRPTGDRDPWVDLLEVTGPVAPALGATVEAALAARTWLVEHTDDDLLAVAWRCADDVTQETHGRFGEDDPTVVLARQGGGLRRVVRLDTVTAGLLSVCDGTLPAAAALRAIADLLDRDADAVASSALPILRDLVADGLLAR